MYTLSFLAAILYHQAQAQQARPFPKASTLFQKSPDWQSIPHTLYRSAVMEEAIAMNPQISAELSGPLYGTITELAMWMRPEDLKNLITNWNESKNNRDVVLPKKVKLSKKVTLKNLFQQYSVALEVMYYYLQLLDEDYRKELEQRHPGYKEASLHEMLDLMETLGGQIAQDNNDRRFAKGGFCSLALKKFN